MPPVEIESIPAVPEVEVASTLKTLDKAMELPIINDAVNMATKLHQQAQQFPTYNQVEAIVTNGVEMVNAGLSEGVKSSVHTAVSSLDSLASTGLDKLTTSVPALATPTEEILPTITGSLSTSAATDYVASFGVVQSGLQLADTALSLGEKALTSLAPSVEETSLAGGMMKQVRVMRRALRAVRHAGRRAGHEGSGGVTGWIMDLLHINAILGFFGLSLTKSSSDGPVATSGEKEDVEDVDETNDDETLAEKLVKDYDNESQDPDYVPSQPTEEDSLEYKSDEEALEASQDISQDPAAEEPEASQDVSQEALEAKSDEEALEASQDKSKDPASEEPEASQDESEEAKEEPAAVIEDAEVAIDEEALEASQDVSKDPASEELEASQDESQEAEEQPAAVIEAAEVAIDEEALEASQDKSEPAAVIEATEVAIEACHGESLEKMEASQDESQEDKEQKPAVIEATEVVTEVCHGESLENLEDSEED